MQQAEKLTWSDQLWNAFNIAELPVRWFMLLWFWISINTRRQSKDRSFATPRPIQFECNLNPPGYAHLALWKYGVATCGGIILRVIRNGRRTREHTLYVSSRQHWLADRTLRAAGWNVISTPVADHHRGDSSTSAQKGSWRAWGVRAKPAGGDHALMETAARWLGLVE